MTDVGDTDKTIQWFVKHPLIATVLWIVGADLQPLQNDNPEQTPDDARLNKLSWRDDHGGNIAEYLGQVQKGSKFSEGKNGTAFEEEDSTRRRSNSRSNNTSNLLNLSDKSHSRSVGNGPSSPPQDQSMQSPQWGFYVSITPPQEFHAQGDPGSRPAR